MPLIDGHPLTSNRGFPQYEQFVDTIREALSFHARGIKDSLRAQANYISSEAAERNQSFPFVTIGTFEIEGLSVRAGSSVKGTVFTPLIDASEIEEWNAYASRDQQAWLTKSRKDFEASPDFVAGESFAFDDGSWEVAKPYLSTIDEASNALVPVTTVTSGPSAPWWQTSPPPSQPASSVNLDLLSPTSDPSSQIQALFEVVQQTREGVFGEISPLPLFVDSFAKTKFELELRDGDELFGFKSADLLTGRRSLQEDGSDGDDNYHPLSLFMQPVFEDMFDPQSKIVGLIHAVINWDAYVVSLLPPGVDNLLVVLSNDCGQVYSYQVNGPNVSRRQGVMHPFVLIFCSREVLLLQAVYLGPGDMKEEKYNNKHFRFDLPFEQYMFPETTKNTAGHCSYTYTIYPTSIFEEEYRTPLPIILTIIIGGTFTLMALTFGIYDFFVNRRNRKVVDAAAKFNSIVSSLFPENVRERLFADAEEKMRKNGKVKAFRSVDDFLTAEENFDDSNDKRSGRPIADLFPETSILFADIAGFTGKYRDGIVQERFGPLLMHNHSQNCFDHLLYHISLELHS